MVNLILLTPITQCLVHMTVTDVAQSMSKSRGSNKERCAASDFVGVIEHFCSLDSGVLVAAFAFSLYTSCNV